LPVRALRRQLHDSHKPETCLWLLATIVVGIWLYSLVAFSISIDQELAAFRSDQRVWIAQGRWLTYYLTVYVLPQPVVPYLPTLIFCASLLASYLLIITAHRFPIDIRAVVLFVVFCGFPVWYFIAEFYANLLSVAVGQLLVSYALVMFAIRDEEARLWSRMRDRIWSLMAIGVLVGVATGAYQSFLAAFAAMAVGSAFWARFTRRSGGGSGLL